MNAKKDQNFMRSLCMGEIEQDLIFPFPKMAAQEKETLNGVLDSVRTLLKEQEKNFRVWDRDGEIPKEFLETIKQFGLFSLIVPESFGGLGFSSTAYSRTLQEISLYDGSVALTVGAHSSIGMRGLVLFGTEEQKQRYLPKLATGEMIAAFCLTEPGAGSDAAGIKTKATRTEKGWVLNGEKLWITNGGIADFFTVFARTDGPEGIMTAFIVTRDMAGVSTGPHEDKMGLRASSTTTLVLENVQVGHENVLGPVGKGFKTAMKILNVGRTGLGGGAIGGMKKSIELATKQAKGRIQFGKPIAEFGLVKQKIGQMVVDTYASEAVVSMVGHLTDEKYEDYAVEAAISKVFASEALTRAADEALQIAGGNGFMREFPYERTVRDTRIFRIFEGTNEILRLFIALTAMNDAGQSLKEVAQSLGGVLQDPIKGFGVLSDYARRRVTQATGVGQATLSKAHPLIKEAAVIFESGTRHLSAETDRLLRKYGKHIVEKQFATKRLADIMIDLYVLACVISRVTASIEEKGEAKAGKEIEIAKSFAFQADLRIKHNLALMDENDDDHIKSLADHALQEERFAWDTL